MYINVTYDPSVARGPDPVAFRNAVDYSVNLFESIFTNNVTINIKVGFGEINNSIMSSGAVGQNVSYNIGNYAYSEVKSALEASSVSAASLPSSDPTNGQGVQMTLAEAKALGMNLPSNLPEVDGFIGISSVQSLYYGTTGTPAAGQYDLVATMEHELSEIMGHYYGGPNSVSSVLNLYSYSSSGVLTPAGSVGSYFSTNRGQTALAYFNAPETTGGGDYADWAPRQNIDAFDAFSTAGAAPPLSASDIAMMQALGWQTYHASTGTSVVGTGFNIAGNGENDLISQASDGTLSVGQLTSAGNLGTTVQAGNNTITLTSANAGARVNLNGAIVVLGNGSSATVSGLSNTVNVGNSSAATVSGTGNIVNAGIGNGIGLVGDRNTLNAGAYTTAVDYGDNDQVTIGSSSHLTVFGNGSRDNIYGVGSLVALAGSNSQTTVGDNSVVLISGYNNLVGAGSSDTIAISGAFNRVFSGASTLALDAGNTNTISAGATSAITNIGSNGTDSAGSGSTFLVAGSSNLFLVNPSSAYVMGSAGVNTLRGTIANFAGVLINGLSDGISIDVTDLIPSGVSTSVSGSASGGVLTLSNANQYLALATYGAINPGALHVSNDSSNGTLLTYGDINGWRP